MNSQEFLNEYKSQEDKMLFNYITDKINFVKYKTKIEYTNFLNLNQISLVEKFLKKIKFTNYILWGGYENAERKILIVYSDKLAEKVLNQNYEKIMSIIRIRLNELDYEKYTHRNYLGGIMKLGIERNKIGDILVDKTGADIIILNDIKLFLLQQLPMLTRFENSSIYEENIKNIKYVEPTLQTVNIIVPSLRLDNFVSDLARTSRNKALDIIKSERVFINGLLETKASKQIKMEDVITIRGKGRFTVNSIEGKTKSGRLIISITKYI